MSAYNAGRFLDVMREYERLATPPIYDPYLEAMDAEIAPPSKKGVRNPNPANLNYAPYHEYGSKVKVVRGRAKMASIDPDAFRDVLFPEGRLPDILTNCRCAPMFTPEERAIMGRAIVKPKSGGMVTRSRIVGEGYSPGATVRINNLDATYKGQPFITLMSNPPKKVRKSMWLTLIREPDNRADANAVQVWDTPGGQRLGYLPRQDAAAVARILDQGLEVRCEYIGDRDLTLSWEHSSPADLDSAYAYAIL